ncbi:MULTISPECIES: hypothetical protein [Staphylococcus]|uniref:hypothetical protein n=1 Tax=Staphylococcus TaxID=1279 RepID=UPI0011A0259E|nr:MULTISPECIES: hypothetical protein [Staphylococcus]MDW4003464.1 hypothetical protein [Staphylococcus saprophyticus]
MNTLATIEFISKDYSANIIGYLEVPDNVSTQTKHEVFIERGEFVVRYYDDNKKIIDYIDEEDYRKLMCTYSLNDWDIDMFYSVIELKNWERVLL